MPSSPNIPAHNGVADSLRSRLAPARDLAWRPALTAALRTRACQLAIVWTLLLLLTSSLIWASTWLRPWKPVRLLLVGAGYQQNLGVPHNVYGWHGLQQLATLAHQSSQTGDWGAGLIELAGEPVLLRTETAWDEPLAHAGEQTVVVVISAHGGADAQGAYLLPHDVDVADEKLRALRVAAVLDRLAQLPKEQHKLLILDATQVRSNWTLGMLENEFSRLLESLDSRILEIPNLVVVSSSGINERSWVCDEWRETIFSHYLIEALRGGAHDLDHNGRIDFAEAFQFIQTGVNGWVLSNRDACQQPVLLPKGAQGLARARRMDLAPVRADYTPPDPHATPIFIAPPGLLAAWETRQTLVAQTPGPWVFAPYLWRSYEDHLLRYEQLVRAGDQESSNLVLSSIRETLNAIDEADELDLGCLQNNQALPAAAALATGAVRSFGVDGQQTVSRRDLLANLWDASPDEFTTRWTAMQAKYATYFGGALGLRWQLYEALLDRLCEEVVHPSSKGERFLRALDDPLKPRPAEMHFLVMMARDLPARGENHNLAQLFQRALKLRRRAEQVALNTAGGGYPYSEQALSWTKGDTELGDRSRRYAEDLLLGAAADWQRADTLFSEAEEAYGRASTDGTILRDALQVRNRVLVSLPYYSKWLAGRAPSTNQAKQRDEQLFTDVETLWQRTHALTERLQAGVVPPSDRVAIAQQTEQIRQGFTEIERAFQQDCQDLADVDLPSVCRDTDEALFVPCANPQLRMKLLTNKRRTSRRLLIETSGLVSRSPRPQGESSELSALAMAARQGRLALASLGQPWFDRCPGERLEAFDQVRHRLQVFAVEARWWQSTMEAGEQLRRRWQQIPPAMQTAMRAARVGAPGAVSKLESADSLARLALGANHARLDADPAVALRRARFSNLLLWLADRTWQDHWFSEEPNALPYYRRAASLYLADAKKLGADDSLLAPLMAKISGPGQLEISTLPHQYLTTEQRYPLAYQLRPAAGASVPPGYPAMWMTAGSALQLVEPAAGSRNVFAMVDMPSPPTVKCVVANPRLTEEEAEPTKQWGVDASEVIAEGRFRGQVIRQATPVDVYRAPEVTFARQPLPARASVAVRADLSLHQKFGEGSGAVAVVLDCSGSMGPGRGQAFTPQTRYAQATQALRHVLQGLPSGAQLSVWTFGAATGPEKTVDVAEQTIRRVQAPVRWERGNALQLAEVMGRIEYPAIEPWNESPIVAAMLAASADLRGVAGFKTLLVITDGMDNRWAADRRNNALKLDVGDALRQAFQDQGITINVVGFQWVQAERDTAQRQFRVVESLSPPGRLYTVDKTDDLIAALESVVRQRLRFHVEDYDTRPVKEMPAAGIEVSRASAGDRWLSGGLPPDGYLVAVHTDQRLAKEIRLDSGDLLLLRLAGEIGEPTFSRAPFTADDYPWKPAAERQGWRIAVLQNQQLSAEAAQMLITLEKTPDARETVLRQLRPRETWIELSPLGAHAPVSAFWRYEAGYPTAAWSFDVLGWSRAAGRAQGAPPLVRVWWNPDQDPTPTTRLDREQDFGSLDELRGRKITAGDTAIEFENAAIESHAVETRAGVREIRSCLVLRVRYSGADPLRLGVEGLDVQGEEHRHFASIGRSTALFWPVTADEAQKSLATIKIFALAEFKRQAERRGFYLEMKDLPPPLPTDVRPRPVMELK